MQVIKEGGLSRLWSHTQDDSTMAIIGSQDKDTKESRFSELLQLVKSTDLGYKLLKGSYTYDDGTIGEEDSVAVFNIPLEVALDIAKKINQETIVWKDTDFFGFLTPQGKPDGEFISDPRNMTFNDVEAFGSRIAKMKNKNRGRKFAFKMEQYFPEKTGSSLYRLGDKNNKLSYITLFECTNG